ncbi:hypothetical protein IFM89_019241 [Coptis chinensis]|uniref:PHD finger family protein n=1 Tax=Coptis chinensis TaxID=261450 RepID=A0A835LMS5_9MAGN|nr:hypothetical protein IFM89_019241 [Coptis chinensis]
MIENRCQLQNNMMMMGRGIETGCGPITISKVSLKRPQQQHKEHKEEEEEEVDNNNNKKIDFFEQARKALSEKCLYDSEEVLNSSRVTTLPVGLSELLSKAGGSSHHKRRKKSGAHLNLNLNLDLQSGGNHHKVRGSTSSKGRNNIWVETEDYFRPLELKDIDVLFDKSSFCSLVSDSCFTLRSSSSSSLGENASVGEVVEGGLESRDVVVVKEEKGNEQRLMEIDGAEGNVGDLKESEGCSNSTECSSSSSIEWLLGARDKILLASERPSKKRTKLGSEAGLDRLRLVCPSEGYDSPVCHVCCLGDLGEQANQLLVCDSCKVTVHQKCYGVEELSDGVWLCSWCQYCSENGVELISTPCLLCPKAGGALKPVASGNAGSKSSVPVKFVHLFCSQWMPEVYVEDTRKMEPIMNVEGINDKKKKLICHVCKVKCGACIRCTEGICRTSFHPICAREAKHRMEIWGKTGDETVELKAFCSKHSDIQENSIQQSDNHPSVPTDCDSSSVKLPVNKPHKLKFGRKNGDKNMVLVPSSDTISTEPGNSEISSEQNSVVPKSETKPESECRDARSSFSVETADEIDEEKTPKGTGNCDTMASDSLDSVQVLKKLVDRGKAILSDVASEIGISSDLLATTLAGDLPSNIPDLRCKIVQWLRSHAYMGRVQSESSFAISFKAMAGPDGYNVVAVEGDNNSNTVSLKLTPPRIPSSNIWILKDKKVLCSKGTDVQLNDNAIGIGETNVHALVPNGDIKEFANGNGSLFLDGNSCCKDKDDKEKVSSEPSGYQELSSSIEQAVRPQVELANGSSYENDQANAVDDSVRDGSTNTSGEHPVSSVDLVTPVAPNLLTAESASSSFIHPFIQKRLMQLQSGGLVAQKMINFDSNGVKERESFNVLSKNSGCCSPCADPDHTSSDLKLEQLVEAKRMEILELSPEDEVEGEIVYLQNKLIDRAVTSRRFSDDLVFRAIKALPGELDAERKRRWDSVLVNQYLCSLKEAKKQGRKERRHKEAQAVLAAATAAAAASSRISSFRKDSNDEMGHQELNAFGGRTPLHSQLMPRAKETLSRLAVGRVPSEKPSDVFQLKSVLNEHQQLCDICRRSETMLNPIIVCCNCKVSVHFGCYRGVKDHIGPWYCELCEELFPFGSPRSLSIHSREKSAVAAQCGLCGGSTGAFRKSTDGQWVHAFCAEWLLESAFRRGQANLVEGMETILKAREVCCICCRKIGLCIKCNYGNCQSTFHPSCARNAGFYMHVKTGGGKLQHKAYCDKHSLEQKEKVESQQHGPEELKAVKQIRVELERVRLLCERIIKREKVKVVAYGRKRELVICSHNILASKRDSVAFSVLVRSPFFLPDVSSESATTSLRGHVDDNKSCSDAMQRSEDITVDSALSGKRRVICPVQMDIDQRTDDSSTSQQFDAIKPTDRPLSSGKQLPQRPESINSRNLTDDEERSKLRKYTETFQKELVMTSDQASVQNQRLPKGFAYVPIVCLPKEKPAHCERGSDELLGPDG